jgi:predicted ribosome quality control (RQC) complex YloA/Tae2 family protein
MWAFLQLQRQITTLDFGYRGKRYHRLGLMLCALFLIPEFYIIHTSTAYYEDQKKLHDFYLDLGNQCRISEEKRQALRKAQLEAKRVELEAQNLQEYINKAKMVIDESKRVEEENRKLSHALMEYNYTKDKELVSFTDPDAGGIRMAWRDSLSPEEEIAYREYLRKDLGSDKIDVVNKIK